MMKKKKAPLVWTFIFTAFSGLAFGLALSASVMLCLLRFDQIYAFASFGGLLGGIVFLIFALICLLRYKTLSDRYNAIAYNFLGDHPRLLLKDAFLARVEKENLGVAVIDYAILSKISSEEKAQIAPRLNEIPLQRIESFYKDGEAYWGFIPPTTLLFACRKGDLKANAEEISKQSLSTFGLDPTLPLLKLLIGIEDNKELDASTKLLHARIASSYDTISRLSGEVLPYDRAMEVANIGEGFDIQSAIKEERLEISYVPLYNKRNKTAAMLAEVKLFDPSRGLIHRRELYREGDNLGFSPYIDSFVASCVVRHLLQWDVELRHKVPLLVIPCSKTTFYEATFLFNVKKFALENNVALSRICLGVPAKLLIDDEPYTANLAKKAHALGLKIGLIDFSAKCPIHRFREILPDLVSFDEDVENLDPRMFAAEVAILSETASLVASPTLNGIYTPDLYPQKEATPEIALENLRLEEEFRL